MLAGGLRPLPGRLVTDSRSALGARRARPHATPFAQQHLKFHGPPNSGRSVAEWAPSLKKATGASRPSLQQRLPGAEGPPEGRSTAPRHAACGGPIPSSRGPVLIYANGETVQIHTCEIIAQFRPARSTFPLDAEWKGCSKLPFCAPPTARQEKHGMVPVASLPLTKRRARAQDVSLRHHPQLRR